MSKKILNLLATIMIFLTLFITGCSDASDQEMLLPGGTNSYNDIRPYTFNPETILATLDQGNEKIFQPLPDKDLKNVFPPGSFLWQQQDYLKITDTLNQIANQDSLKGWSVYSISSYRYCADNPKGFDNLSITYFKTKENRYDTRIMDVWPLAKDADWAGNMEFPRPFPFGWKSIDLEKIKVSTDNALQVAEANGGKAIRQAANNDCSILVILSPNVFGSAWAVQYVRGGYANLFRISIDPYTSEYKIITP